MTADQRVIAYHLGRLKDKRAEVRLDTIAELAELGDSSALPALEEVYRSDDDAAVRQAALMAGREIFRKQKQ